MIKISPRELLFESAIFERSRSSLESFFKEHNERLHQLRAPQPSTLALRQALGPLKKLFNGKCAYCERITRGGQIDHFRPRSVTSADDTPYSHLYYSWLMYAPQNMLYSCVQCANSKGSFFPVTGSRAGLLANVAECRVKEDALLLDPTFDEPTEHIHFSIDGSCKFISAKGEVTVNGLRLNRPDLVEARKKTLQATLRVIQELSNSSKLSANSRLALITALLGFTDESAEFAGAARYILSDRLRQLKPATWTAQLREGFAAQGWHDSSDAIVSKEPSIVSNAIQLEMEVSRRMRLSRIVIDNFKGLEHISLTISKAKSTDGGATEPPGCLVLLGENAVGKSTVLEAVSLALSDHASIQQLGLIPNRFISRSDKEIVKKLPRVRLYFDGMRTVGASIQINENNFVSDIKRNIPFIAYGPRRFYVRSPSTVRPSTAANMVTLFDPLSTLEDPEQWLLKSKPAEFDAAVRALREILMLSPSDFVTTRKDPISKLEQLVVATSSNTLPIHDMSEGYRAVIATVIDIIRNLLNHYDNIEMAAAVVLIDEIDVHLHPRWKLQILGRLRLAFPNVQFIVTTHDPLCLRGAKNGEVCVLRRDNGGVGIVPELPNVEALSVQQLLTSDYFGLLSAEDPITEGKRERHLILSQNPNRSRAEEAELKNLRHDLGKNLALGESEEDRLLLKVMEQHNVERRMERGIKKELSSETAKRMLAILRDGDSK
jgi:hypothetical protein